MSEAVFNIFAKHSMSIINKYESEYWMFFYYDDEYDCDDVEFLEFENYMSYSEVKKLYPEGTGFRPISNREHNIELATAEVKTLNFEKEDYVEKLIKIKGLLSSRDIMIILKKTINDDPSFLIRVKKDMEDYYDHWISNYLNERRMNLDYISS